MVKAATRCTRGVLASFDQSVLKKQSTQTDTRNVSDNVRLNLVCIVAMRGIDDKMTGPGSGGIQDERRGWRDEGPFPEVHR